jgi:hypothetical protein
MDDIGVLHIHMAIWSILRPFGIYFMVILYILSRFGMLYQEKSGNPGSESLRRTP